MKKLLNIEYASIHASYWMFYGVISSFSSVFLLARGYSNSEIGMILAIANILAVILQPLTADLADRSRRFSLIGITRILTVSMMILTMGLLVLKGKTLGLSVIFILLIAWHTVLHPLFNSLNFKLQESGIHINFGIARSMGSLAYAALVGVLGTLVENFGISVLPVSGEIILVMLLISLFFIGHHFDRAATLHSQRKNNNEKNSPDKALQQFEEINLIQFIKRNKTFFVINLGVIGLYFSNSILNNYMMQIVNHVGGDSEDMGRILALMAFLEIPTLVFFDQLHKKLSYQMMLKIGAVGFTVKIVLCFLANSVAVIFIAQILQLASFALFLPAMIHYIDEIMNRGEAVKGQALFTTMITITTIFSSLTGGLLLDYCGVKILTLTASLVTGAGALTVILALNRSVN